MKNLNETSKISSIIAEPLMDYDATSLTPLIIENTANYSEDMVLFDKNAKKHFFNIMENAKGFMIAGTYKLQKNQLPNTELLQALRIITEKGVPTKVIVESRITLEEIKGCSNLPIGAALEAFNVTGVKIISDLPLFKNAHFKVLLTEDTAVIGTTNFDDNNNAVIKRDFSLIMKEVKIIEEIKNILNSVEKGEEVLWPIYTIDEIKINENKLSWGPKQHKKHIIEIIKNAKNDIEIYQQDLQDETVVEELAHKVKENINVRILMSHYPFGNNNPNNNIPNLEKLLSLGAHIRLTGDKTTHDGLSLHIHAKVLLVDRQTPFPIMYLGSANFYPKILDPNEDNLNLGLITKSIAYIDSVSKVFESDWLNHEGCDFNQGHYH